MPREALRDYRRIKIEADLNGIKAALKGGDVVPGAGLETRNNLVIG